MAEILAAGWGWAGVMGLAAWLRMRWTLVWALLWAGLALGSGDRRMFFPYCLYLAAVCGGRKAVWVMAAFFVVRVTQGASIGVMAVEAAVVPVALLVGWWAGRWGLDEDGADVAAGGLAAVIGFLGLAL